MSTLDFLNSAPAGSTPMGISNFSNPNYSPAATVGIADQLTQGLKVDPLAIADLGNAVAGGTPGAGDGGFMSTFKNGDGSLNLGNIGQGIGALGNIFSTFMALKQFGMAKDAHEMNMNLTRDNHANNIALAQQQIDDRARRREIDNQASRAAASQAGLSGPVAAPTLRNSFSDRSQKGI